MTSNGSDERAKKRQKLSPGAAAEMSADEPFSAGLFASDRVSNVKKSYERSQPYHHAVLPELFDPAFLSQARKEITECLSFREKETDIYKIEQTGDLTNLDGLPQSELDQLPTLLKLRDALYSKRFRHFLSDVTGCGPLSGSKTDMSCAEYSSGCYLLNHDDVIGTRRVSFILYLTQPGKWSPKWGGALELYDTVEMGDMTVPIPVPTVSIPPSFNQFTFFEVQPGHSFHSVEEVSAHRPETETDDVRGGVGKRLSLSGWFHAPVEGEEGYVPHVATEKSSLQQLYKSTLIQPTPYADELPLPLPVELSESTKKSLSKMLNPAYLVHSTLARLRQEFVDSSQLLLSSFLHPDLVKELSSLLQNADKPILANRVHKVDGINTSLIPAHDAGAGAEWQLTGPPHIQRFLSLTRAPEPGTGGRPRSRVHQILSSLVEMYSSDAFREWLAVLTALVLQQRTVQARRFRPGLDYTLAKGEPAQSGDARLDVTLHLTPELDERHADPSLAFEEGQVGGWDLYLAPDGSSDEATYGAQKTSGDAEGNQEEDDDDGPLLALPPQWNALGLVLRDPGVLRFTKYVSTKAEQSRFDVYGEWQVGMVETEEEDDEQ